MQVRPPTGLHHAVDVPVSPDAPLSVRPDVLPRLLAVMERLAASTDLPQVLGVIIDSMRDCLHADRASVFQFDPGRHELFITQAHGLAEIRFSTSRGIAGEAARTGQILNIPDCYADPRFNPDVDRRTGYHTRSMLTIPLLSSDGGLEGVAQVLNKDPAVGPSFDDADEAVARALAGQAAIAIRRARYIESELRKEKIEADLKVARTIQQSSWPKDIPDYPALDIAAHARPADETGGDAYDLVRMDCGKLLVLLCDATGHGIGPALCAAQFRAMARMAGRCSISPGEAMAMANNQLCGDLPAGRFVTAFLGVMDPAGQRLSYVAAGQAPMLVIHPDGRSESRDATTLPLGIEPGTPPEEPQTIDMLPGSVFLLLSDGYFEAKDPSGRHFGEAGVLAAARSVIDGSAQLILDTIARAAATHAAGVPFDDDQTAIVIKRR
ncbi:MAG: protein phosphatase [Planctomyces sp.]|nr:protein phosphatase [Planctomyces sp.]